MAISILRFDLRAPAFAKADSAALTAAALDMGAYADEKGFSSIVLSEHHGTDDGYLPAPLALAAPGPPVLAPPAPTFPYGGEGAGG